jgi:GntR family transcriptional regulator, histidine utilization repressor
MPNRPLLHETCSLAPPKPLYEQVKSHVLQKISSGEWPPYCRLPSEHTLVKDLEISRMTIHRALRELTQAGFLERIQGVGTFVAASKKETKLLELKEIDQVIRSRGSDYHCDIHFLQAEPADTNATKYLAIPAGEKVYRSYVVHRENNVPLMLEDRYVSPELLPGYLQTNLESSTADNYIASQFAVLSHENSIQAVISDAEISHFLELETTMACLILNRRSWYGEKIVSAARMVFPSTRYQIS